MNLLHKASGSVEAFVPVPHTGGKGHCSDECAEGKEEFYVVWNLAGASSPALTLKQPRYKYLVMEKE